MKRNVLLAAALFVALAVIGLLGQPAAAYGQEGAVLTGVWHWQCIVPGGTLSSFMIFHNDGTVFGSDSLAFGGIPTNPFNFTPFYGVYERTGAHAYTMTFLTIPFYRAGPWAGYVAGIVRVRANFWFDGDFDHIAGELIAERLLSDTNDPSFPKNCPDPLAPGASWVTMWSLPFHAARVSVVPY